MKIDERINGLLAAVPDDKRPDMSTRAKVRSVIIASRRCLEATDANGNAEFIPIVNLMAWVRVTEAGR